jgi:hypothetical protein
LLETANMIEPKLHYGASAVVSICPYKKPNKVFFFTTKLKQIRNRRWAPLQNLVFAICPCGKMNNSFFLETNKPHLAQKVF